MRPAKATVPVAGHLEWTLPLRISRHVRIGRQEQVEEAAEEEIAVGADRVGLKAPGRDAIRRPPRRVVLAAQALRQKDEPLRRITIGRRVVADQRQPIDRRPECRVPADELVGDPGVDLAPRRGDVGVDRERVCRLAEIESRECAHRCRAVAVPPRERLALARPVVRRGRLVPDEAEPAAAALVDLASDGGGHLRIPAWARRWRPASS